MADGLNRVMLLGNLGADRELHITPGGQAFLKLRLATNENYLDRNNVRQERTEWHRVTVWGRRAEALGKILQKGDLLFVEGRLQTSSYEKNGEKRYSTEVVAVNIALPGSGRGRGEGAPTREGGRDATRERAPQRDSAAPDPAYDDFGEGSAGGSSGGGCREARRGYVARDQPTKGAYRGREGPFAHAAARSPFGLAARYCEAAPCEGVFDAVSRRDAHHGVVPIENSSEGSSNTALDA